MPALSCVTPILLTYNEAPNIERSLAKLSWAFQIVVVDSYSNDGTLEILAKYPQVRIFMRKFDNHAQQYNYAIKETGIKTDWILALDADYILTEEFIEELRILEPKPEISGYRSRFSFCVFGHSLRGTMYPPRVILFKNGKGSCIQDGHGHRVTVSDNIGEFTSKILHDDRKPLDRWIRDQYRYAEMELEKLRQTPFWELGWPDRIRKMRVAAPFLVGFYCLFIKGTILDGFYGFYYVLKSMIAEMILSLCLLQADFSKKERR